MGAKTRIEWCDATWNPVRGCSRVSEGCRNCYAERIAARFSGGPCIRHAKMGCLHCTDPSLKAPFNGFAETHNGKPRWTGHVQLIEDMLEIPLRWRKPRRIFINSMSDLFHESLPDGAIDRVFGVMKDCPQHTFQILTKRAKNMRRVMSEMLGRFAARWAWWTLPNVWLGVSCENQATADERIPLLLQTPAAVRFVSLEPLLGPVDLTPWFSPCWYYCDHDEYGGGHRPSRGLEWVIVGGESGPGARPMHPDWVRAIRDQCRDAGVPLFFKQWGKWEPVCALYGDPDRDTKENGRGELFAVSPSGEIVEDRQPPAGSWLMEPIGKKAAGRLLDGRDWSEFPGGGLRR